MGTGYGGAFAGVGAVILWCSIPYVLLGLFVGLSIAFRFKSPSVYIAMFFAILVTLGILVSVFGGMVMIGLMAAPYGLFTGLIASVLISAPIYLVRRKTVPRSKSKTGETAANRPA